MKTALKIIGGIIGILIAAVAIFWLGWLSPPSADDVCDNVVSVTKAELEKEGGAPSDAALGELRTKCEKRASKAPEFGRGVWVKQLKCMRDAEDGTALEGCRDIKSM